MSDLQLKYPGGKDALPLRPDDLSVFRWARLTLLLEAVPKLPEVRPADIERISLYDFFADNPFLVFARGTVEHQTLLLAGFDAKNLSYQSSAQRYSSRRERLQSDLARLVAFALVEHATEDRRITYRLTEAGHGLSKGLQSLYANSYRESVRLIGRELNRYSDMSLRHRSRDWLQADELLIDLFHEEPRVQPAT